MARFFFALAIVLEGAAVAVALYDGPTALIVGLMIAGGIASVESI